MNPISINPKSITVSSIMLRRPSIASYVIFIPLVMDSTMFWNDMECHHKLPLRFVGQWSQQFGLLNDVKYEFI